MPADSQASAEELVRDARTDLAASARSARPGDPFAPSLARGARARGESVDCVELLRDWARRVPGSPVGRHRHRWTLPPVVAWDGQLELAAFRRAEHHRLTSDRDAFVDRLLVPIISSNAMALLADLAADGDAPSAELARQLLDAEAPVFEEELAGLVRARDAWGDTFALWVVTGAEPLIERFNPLLTAISARFAVAALRSAGVVCGKVYPWKDVALPSASAHLATTLTRLGIYPRLLPTLIRFVAGEVRSDGGWGDPGQPSDALTTLAAADLLAHVDPGYDPAPTIAYLARERQGGGWSVLGPERPWLTGAVHDLLLAFSTPFADRFRWPRVPPWMRDRHTRIPGFGHFLDLDRVLSDLPIASEQLDVAFIDLAGFGQWNTAQGQAAGDEVLALLAAVLDEIPAARAIRDGGDEFVLVGAPRRGAMDTDLQILLDTWPARWTATFGPLPVVSPRIVVVAARAGDLRSARERLGKAIGDLKALAPDPGPHGALLRVDR